MNVSFLELQQALIETTWMVGLSTLGAVAFGIPLGVVLFGTSPGLFWENRLIHRILGTASNVVRSLPFVILLIVLIPLTKTLLGTSTGPTAASVSLMIAGIPFYARLVESALHEVDQTIIEAAEACGASAFQTITDVLLSEAKPSLWLGLTVTVISLLGYSAMAGLVGGGGIGDFAIRYGYHRFETGALLVTVALLIALVQALQWLGDRLAQRARK